MHPAQTSFIPVQVALARFLESQGWRAIFQNYPYWYLGTTPFRYLTGPVLPSLLVFSHKLLSGLSLFEIFFGWLAIFWFFGALGVYWLVRELGARKVAFLAAIFYALGPLVPFLFRFSDGLSLIAFSFLPYVLGSYTRTLAQWSRKLAISCILLISFVMLLETSIIPSLILGMVAIFLATTGWKKAEERLKKSFLIFAFSFLLSSLWYTPGYWWHVWLSPSFAGRPLFKVVSELAQLLPIALAIGLAIFSGKIKTISHQSLIIKFCFYWLFIFGFLTLMRFIADPDFWLDWTAYYLELKLGLAIVLGWLISKKTESRLPKVSIGAHLRGVMAVFYFLLFAFTFNKYVLGTLQKDITQSVEYRIGQFLSERIKPREKVFLSGSSVFWLNAFFDLVQVRGGRDPAAVHPTWDKAAWEIREGREAGKSLKWLDELEIDYLVVHSLASLEYYHDFVYPEKFENNARLEKIYDEGGDKIYRRH